MSVLRLFQNGDGRGAGSEYARIAAAQQGDRRAFDALAGAYTPLLRRFLASRISVNGVDDVLQDTLLAAWTGLPKYTRRSGFKAWLFAIAVHKCTDYYRARGKSANDVPLEQADFLPTAPDSRADAYAVVERQMDARAALALLPPEQREVLELYYFAELSLPETAAALNRNLNTVKYQFYRAHTQAEQHLRAMERPDGSPQADITPDRRASKAASRAGSAGNPGTGETRNKPLPGNSTPDDDTAERKVSSKP